MPRHDPYKAFNFRVEIDGMTAAFTEVSGLESEVETIDYREGGEETRVRKLPGLRKYSHIVLKRGLTSDADLWNWHNGFLTGKGKRRDGLITLQNELGVPLKVWKFDRGLPVKWLGPTFNARQSEVAIKATQSAVNAKRR